jgi:hypothetical protein
VKPFFPILAMTLTACDDCSSKKPPEHADRAPAPTTVADAAPINATVRPLASIEAVVNPDHLAAYVGPTGSVEGTVHVTGDRAPEMALDFRRCPDAAKTYGHTFREGQPLTPNGPRWLADAVVAVTGYAGFFIREKAEATEVTIEGCAFSKRTVTLTFGQRLEVKNLTQDFWTPTLIPTTTNTAIMMATPNGDPVKIYPKAPGHYYVYDRDRTYAGADVFVLAQPLHAVSSPSGSYRIDGVPIGKMTINASHPQVSGADAAVTVDIKEGVVHHVDLTLDYKRPDAGAKVDAGAYPILH